MGFLLLLFFFNLTVGECRNAFLYTISHLEKKRCLNKLRVSFIQRVEIFEKKILMNVLMKVWLTTFAYFPLL